MFQWRSFKFFDKKLVLCENQLQDNDIDNDSIESDTQSVSTCTNSDSFSSKDHLQKKRSLLHNIHIQCCTCGRGQLIFGDADGRIYVYNRHFQMYSFQAHDISTIHLHRMIVRNILVSIGLDLASTATTIKFWHLVEASVEQHNRCPQEAQAIKPFSFNVSEAPVTCMSITEDMSQLCLGLGNGCVLLFDGDILRGRYRTLMLQQIGACVTGVHFREGFSSTLILFVTTTAFISTYATKDKQHAKRVLDSEEGCDIACSTLSVSGELIVARRQAVFYFNCDDVGPCYGFEGVKKRCCSFGDYIIVVLEDANDAQRNSVCIYDLANKLIAFNSTFDVVLDILVEFGSIFIVTATSRNLFEIRERDLHSKMKMLFKRNLYTKAISVAQTQRLGDDFVMDVRRKYADHLYIKGDISSAMKEYISTVVPGRAFTSPSYVIRKYLDATCSNELTEYLEVLHKYKCASKLHTSLLLNCFTKANQTHKLESFLTHHTSSDGSWSAFDVDTAISVCRDAKYFDFALTLAKNYNKHNTAIKIMSNDLHQHRNALQFIQSLPFDEAQLFMRDFGENLITHIPDATLEFLKNLCTSYGNNKLNSSFDDIDNYTAIAKPEHFVHLFVDDPRRLQDFLEFVTLHIPSSSSIVYTTLLELYLRNKMYTSANVIDSQSTDNNTEVYSSMNNEYDKNDDNNSNIMVNGEHSTTDDDDEDSSLNRKIMVLLRTQQSKYDAEHALTLSKRYQFKQGMVFLYDKLCLYNEILEQHMQEHNYASVMTACLQYGSTEPNMWLRALVYFGTQAAQCADYIQQVLNNIDESALLPPLMVVQLLSSSADIPLYVVKDYLIRSLKHQHSIANAERLEIQRYKSETDTIRAKIEELQTGAITFQSSKCSLCTSPLDIPTIHFLCKHSFHQRCLDASNTRKHTMCPKCAPEVHKLVEMHKTISHNASDHESFFKHLHNSSDGFGTVAEYFGRGIVDGVDAARSRSPVRNRRINTPESVTTTATTAVTSPSKSDLSLSSHMSIEFDSENSREFDTSNTAISS